VSKPTISTFELFAMFPDQEAARTYLEGRRWPNGPICPFCGLGGRITARKGGYYRCNRCKEDFTVRAGTILKRSHVPLHKWIFAIYLLVTSREDISGPQLAKRIGVTQKTARFVLDRLSEDYGVHIEKLQGSVEKALDAAADKVLAFQPKPKSGPAKARELRKAKLISEKKKDSRE
jgi:transposase-like protein